MRTTWALIVTTLLAAPLLGAQPLNRTPAPGEYNKPGQTAAAFKLPDGFKAQVFAGEPNLAQPIAMCIDARGRLWVIENFSYPDWKPTGNDRVVILEDTDGDGVHDSRKVFWEGGNFATGIQVGYGGVFVGTPPHLLFIPDRDGDDKPDGEPEVLLDGWGHNDTHETLNSFIWGPDGWLYGCQGVFTHSKVGRPGASDADRVPINAGIWRYHPITKRFEMFAEGGSNQWGVDFNDRGQAFMTACVIPHLYHVVQGGRYKRQAGRHFNEHTYTDIQTIRTHQHYAAAFAGAMVYLGDNFPDSCRDQLFMNNIHASKVHMDVLEPTGSGYVGKLGPYDVDVNIGRKIAEHDARGAGFVNSGDKWYRGLCLRTGPDGGVFINDWYDQRPCHQLRPHDQDMEFKTGRVYKITYGEAKKVSGIDLTKASNKQLVEYQLHKNDWWVRTARRVLAERHAAGQSVDDARAGLLKIIDTNSDVTRVLRAMWALHVTGGIEPELSLRLMNHDDPYVRAWAIQLECEDGEVTEVLHTRMTEMAKDDPSPIVRLYLASACQRIAVDQRWSIVGNLIAHGEDAEDHNLPAMYWYATEPLVVADKTRALTLLAKTKISMLRQYIAKRAAAGSGAANASAPEPAAPARPITVAPAASVSDEALTLRITATDPGPATQASDSARPTTADVAGRKALRFDGDDHLEAPHSKELTFKASDSFSVSVWVHVESVQPGWRGVVTKSRDAAPWWGLWIDPSGKWAFGGSGQNVAGTKAEPGWHHVCLVQEGGTQQRIYVDGALVGTGRAMNADGSGDLWLGGAKSTTEHFRGAIADVRIYRRALSHGEVAYLHKNP